jgi:hypothetical protein
MTRQRSEIQGGTDYTGISLPDIYEHLRQWRKSTNELIQKLTKYKSQVIIEQNKIDYADDVIDFIELSIDLFSRFLSDYDRLLAEIPRGVTEIHIEIISQIVTRSDYHERSCVQFKHNHIEKNLRDESMRPLLDHIYAETRGEVINYSDLHNVIPRLKTYIGSKLKGDDRHRLTVDDTDFLELKPNVFGIGLNLNYVIKRLKGMFSKGLPNNTARMARKRKKQKEKPGPEKRRRKIFGWSVNFWTRLLLPIVIVVAGGLILKNPIQVWINTNAMRKSSLASARGNLARIHLRLLDLHDTANAVSTIDAPSRFKDLHNRIRMQSSFDTSFCRTLEFHAMDLGAEFARAARAYCSVVTDLPESETKMWDTWERDPGVQELLGSVTKVEAQLALVCPLEPIEVFYITNFLMIVGAAQGMGLSQEALLKGSEKLGIPDLTLPQPFLRPHMATFGLNCQ